MHVNLAAVAGRMMWVFSASNMIKREKLEGGIVWRGSRRARRQASSGAFVEVIVAVGTPCVLPSTAAVARALFCMQSRG